MRVGKLYLHEACRDAAIQPVCIEVTASGDLKVLAIWWNVGASHLPWTMNIHDTILVKSNDIAKWHEINKEHRCEVSEMVVATVAITAQLIET